jgi:hypothetical protein
MKTKIVLLAAAALFPAILRADHASFVTVNASASKGYTQRKFSNGAAQRQTYVFYQGKFFGETNDPALQRMTFLDVAKVLAPDLAKQNYFPTRDAGAADLLIVVNWGSTLTDPTQNSADPERQFQFQDKMQSIRDYNSVFSTGSGNADPSPITFQMMIGRNDQFSAQVAASYNARLLGYTDALNREMNHSWAYQDGLSAKAESYLADLNQERYFVVLMAYDFRELRRSHRADDARAAMGSPQFAATTTTALRKSDSAPNPLWSLRMNIRADGNNFSEALPAMSAIAAEYFGKQMDGLATAQTSVGVNGHVEIGETRVLGVK